MVRTRRSFINLLAGVATLPALSAPPFASALAQDGAAAAAPESAADFASLVRQASTASPAPDGRMKAAVEGTLARLDVLAPDHARGRFVLANIAGAEVVAYEDGREVLRSRAIVGAARTRTPQLASAVPSVRLNPPWYVPPSIEPSVRASGAAGFRTVNGRLVQPPGPRNPLGPIRIGLENSDGVFMHGTSDPRLFARERRTLSHGCVRVERVLELAAWMLDVTPEALRAAVATGRTRELVPTQEVRVAIAYLTAWPGQDGRLVLHPDPYGLDRLPRRPIPARVAPSPAARPEPAVGQNISFERPA
ncbi:MAG: L,D-transpeptidase family protein [Acetobacteraceae bacterium]|nr:L,D-transpeptidase family protein [Acetobacteraceae bacterium]